MQLDDFFDYKNTLMEDLLTTESIVKLIDEDIDLEQAPSLSWKLVYPLEYIPDTVEHGHTFICFDVDVQRAINKTYLLPTLFVWVFTHRSKIRLPEGGVRVDKICNEIAKKINGSRNYGLGELDLTSVKRFAPLKDFSGKVMMFTAKEFNRMYDPTKPIPNNRKGR